MITGRQVDFTGRRGQTSLSVRITIITAVLSLHQSVLFYCSEKGQTRPLTVPCRDTEIDIFTTTNDENKVKRVPTDDKVPANEN